MYADGPARPAGPGGSDVLVRQRLPERRPRGDSQLREHPVQVTGDGSVRHEQAAADLLVAQASGGEPGDLIFMRRQDLVIWDVSARWNLAGGAQRRDGAVGPGRRAEAAG